MFEGQLDRVFHALSSMYRRWMLERIADGDVSLLELSEIFPTSFSAVIQHVKVLERAELVSTQKIGRVRICHLEPETLAKLDTWLRRTYASSCDRRQSGLRPADLRLLGAYEIPEGEPAQGRRRR